jgi:hypothetical protein
MAKEQETITHIIEIEFEESCSFGEDDQMSNPEYTDEVVGQSVMNHHEVERKAIEVAENELQWDDIDDLELRDVWVEEVQRDEDEWTVVLSAVLCYTTQEDVWDDDSEEDREEWGE